MDDTTPLNDDLEIQPSAPQAEPLYPTPQAFAPSSLSEPEPILPAATPAPMSAPQPAPTAAPMTMPSAPAESSQPSGQNFLELPIEKIKPNPWQPRKVFKDEYLKELSDSIKEHGILQPLVVVPMPDGNYQIIVGERRWRASQLAGLTRVPVIIRNAMEEQNKLELALIENIQRHNLDPIEEAQAYQQLIDQYKLTQDEVAKKVGKGRPTITNMLRLLNLPLKIQRAIADDVISEGHGRAIAGLHGMERQLAMLDEVIRENMTVRQVEGRVRELMDRPKRQPAIKHDSDPETQAIESELRGKLGTKVKVQKNGEAGKITIEFFSQEELNEFLAKMSRLSS